MQGESVAALHAIVNKEQGFLDQSSASVFIAYASREAADELRLVDGVLSVNFEVSTKPVYEPWTLKAYVEARSRQDCFRLLCLFPHLIRD